VVSGLPPVAILAGGLATRLYPLTESIPKALVEFNGVPFVQHQLRLLVANGVSRAVICAGYRGEMLQDFVGDGRRFGLDVVFSFDGAPLLGTGGALRKALPLLGESFFVLYGDSYLLCSFRAVQEAFMRAGKQGLMTVFRNNGAWDRSNVEFSEDAILTYDKQHLTARMHHIDYGLGLLACEALDREPDGQPLDLEMVYQGLLQRGQLAALEVGERFYEVGSFTGMEDFRDYMSAQLAAHADRGAS
jgi:MurNAc alpha-1-phosphate uridylyltransferase